ncbi:MAG TPA: hypothetical protein VE029_13735 [Rhizobacter sp.]|nr:hypothetical protein [Rhizobacter sp.]
MPAIGDSTAVMVPAPDDGASLPAGGVVDTSAAAVDPIVVAVPAGSAPVLDAGMSPAMPAVDPIAQIGATLPAPSLAGTADAAIPPVSVGVSVTGDSTTVVVPTLGDGASLPVSVVVDASTPVVDLIVVAVPAGPAPALNAGLEVADLATSLPITIAVPPQGDALPAPQGAIDGADTAVSATLPVSVVEATLPAAIAMPAVDLPSAWVPTLAIETALGVAGAAIPLVIAAGLPGVGDTMTLSITITGLPDGATLSAGTHQADGSWLLSGDQLAGLTLTPAADAHGSFELTVTATTHDSLTNTDTSVSADLPVTFTEVAVPAIDLPAVELPITLTPTLAVGAAVGVDHGAIPLDIVAGLADGVAATLIVTVTGLPDGATLSAGTHQSDGSWLLSGDQLAGLTLTPAADAHGSFELTVTATTHDSLTNTDTSVSADLPVSFVDLAAPAIDLPAVELPTMLAPTLVVGAAVGVDHSAIPLDIAAGLPVLGDAITLSVNITGVPEGATLSAGTHQSDGSWLLSGDQLAGLTLTPAADSHGSFELTVTATTHDSITHTDTSVSAGLPVSFAELAVPAIDLPSVELPITLAPTLAVGAATGVGDGAIPLDIAAGLPALGDTVTLSVNITGVPEGATLSAGTHQADGSWLLSGDQLAGLTLTPAADSHGSFELTVTATTHDSITHTDTSVSAELPVSLVELTGTAAPVPLIETPPLLASSLSAGAAAGVEDSPIPLDIVAGLADGIAATLIITVTGLPEGAMLSAGTHQQDGSWMLSGDQLAGLVLTPAADFYGSFELIITATTHDSITGANTSVSTHLPVSVIEAAVSAIDAPASSTPTLSVGTAIGIEDAAIALDIAAGLSSDQLVGLALTPAPDANGSFELTVTATTHDSITDASVSAALPISVVETAVPVIDVPSLVAPALAISADALGDAAILDSTEAAAPAIDMPSSDTPATLAPTLSVGAAVGTEDTAIPLAIGAGLSGPGDTMALSISIGNVPEGATLSAGIRLEDGSWALTGTQLIGLTITPAPDASGSFDLTIIATTHDSLTGTDASVSAVLPVSLIEPVISVTEAPATIDAPPPPIPTLSVEADTAAGLPLADASTGISIVVSGQPEGAQSAFTSDPATEAPMSDIDFMNALDHLTLDTTTPADSMLSTPDPLAAPADITAAADWSSDTAAAVPATSDVWGSTDSTDTGSAAPTNTSDPAPAPSTWVPAAEPVVLSVSFVSAPLL